MLSLQKLVYPQKLVYSQVTHRSGRSKRLKTAMRPSRLQSRNRPIFLFRSNSNFDLKPFTVFADIMSWSNIFQRLTTLSEKKWRRTSQLPRCLTSLKEWPRVILSVFNSKNLVNGRTYKREIRLGSNTDYGLQFCSFLYVNQWPENDYTINTSLAYWDCVVWQWLGLPVCIYTIRTTCWVMHNACACGSPVVGWSTHARACT